MAYDLNGAKFNSYPEQVQNNKRTIRKIIKQLKSLEKRLEQVETDNETHNKNWEALIGDIKELGE